MHKLRTEVVVEPLIAAGLINATLICIWMVIIWILELFLTPFIKGLIPVYPVLLAPLLAPIAHRLVWHDNNSEKSPGERWLGLNWPTDRGAHLVEVIFGQVAFLIAIAASYLFQLIAGNCFGYTGYAEKNLTLLSQVAVVVCVYVYSLAILLFLRYRKIANGNLIGQSPLSSDSQRRIASRNHTLGMLSIPLLLCIGSFYSTPVYLSVVFRQPLSWFILLLFVGWWAAGAIIVRNWNSPSADAFFVGVFVVPSIVYINTLPALMTAIKVGPLNEIY